MPEFQLPNWHPPDWSDPDRPSATKLIVTSLLILSLLFVLAFLIPRWWQRVRGAHSWPVSAAQLEGAREALPHLTVSSGRELAGYDRTFFGPAWADIDHNGCDTRNDLLALWLEQIRTDPAKPCVVVSGVLRDPYTGHTIDFTRGVGTSRAIEIDHVVALADAWRKGASEWDSARALEFANDPANLIPVDGPANQAKSAQDASQWLPPNKSFRCRYVVQQVRVKDAYGLAVSAEEFAAMKGVLEDCRPARDVGGDR